ncbi:MAG: sulfotransferase [Sphingobium sp.]|nr:sulfotransferase [Sphingobium sp.]MCP5397813.1 sulfotransferase [Sphingomonas sp.]
MAKLPTFMIIGAARSGTTALYDLVRQHPQVFMSAIKEPNYFAFEGEPLDYKGGGAEFVNNSVASWDAYRGLFADAPGGMAMGEASPLYLYAPDAARRIKARLPDVKMIAVLRNPIEQAFSHYLYARAQMIEPLDSFDAALAAEPERLRAHWQPLFQYSSFPRYGEQLQRFYAEFPANQLRVFFYEEYRADPVGLLRQIFEFIDVDPSFVPDVSHETNMGGQPRHAWLQNLVMRPNPIASLAATIVPPSARQAIRDLVSKRNLSREKMSDAARAKLVDALQDDIVLLQGLLKKDLSYWLE